MLAEKLSISLTSPVLEFVEQYKQSHDMKSRSQVIETAVLLLRQQTLEAAYREAAQAQDPAFDVTDSDGLADETW